MQLALVLSLLAASAFGSPILESRASGQAILQFEIDQDTFTSDTPIAVPGTLTLNQQLIGATIAEVTGISNTNAVSCQAFDGNKKVAEPFTLNHFTIFNNNNLVEITEIQCSA